MPAEIKNNLGQQTTNADKYVQFQENCDTLLTFFT